MSANLVFIALLVATSRASSDILSTFKALRFTQEPSSYIQFNPDFSQYTHAISVCGWIRSLGSATYPTVFFYGGAELTMLDDGDYICILGNCMGLKSKFTVSKNTWFHTCVTWGASSRSHKYYVNGEMLGSQDSASGRLLKTGQTLTLGNWGGNYGDHEFGGEMVYLNFYAKELTASEVKEMADAGMCINMVVDQHEEVRLLKWEEILEQPRSGTITEIDMTGTCASKVPIKFYVKQLAAKLEKAETNLNETAEELTETQLELSEKKESELSLNLKLDNVSSQLNITLTQLNNTSEELTETQLELNEKKEAELSLNLKLDNVSSQLNITIVQLNETAETLLEVSTRLNETEKELDRTVNELEKYNNTKNKWNWNIFLSEQFINQTVSPEQSDQIRTSWDDIAREIYINIYYYYTRNIKS